MYTMPDGVDSFKLRMVQEKLQERGVTIPHPSKITTQERAQLQILIRDILQLSLNQCNNYLKAVLNEVHNKKGR